MRPTDAIPALPLCRMLSCKCTASTAFLRSSGLYQQPYATPRRSRIHPVAIPFCLAWRAGSCCSWPRARRRQTRCSRTAQLSGAYPQLLAVIWRHTIPSHYTLFHRQHCAAVPVQQPLSAPCSHVWTTRPQVPWPHLSCPPGKHATTSQSIVTA